MAPHSTSKSSCRYAVVVCKGGDIKEKEGCKPWTIYSRKWSEENKCIWFLAVRLFCGEYACASSMSNILATILQPDCLSNKTKRHHIYRKAAHFAGFKERERLPKYFEEAVRAEFPEEDGEYVGFKRA
jgi:hypothetical protein